MSGKLAYIAGPYTHPDPVTNTQEAVRIAERVRAAGGIPIVPHLTMLWHLISPHDVQFWYDYDIEVMLRCDCVYRFPGPSTGADREVAVALESGIHVLWDEDDLIRYVQAD